MAEEVAQKGLFSGFDVAVNKLNAIMVKLILFDVFFFTDAISIPFAVLWLVVAALFLTFRMGFINLTGLKHSINVTRGKYDDPKDVGDVTHFQALTAALSATVGLGNIAGVAIAVKTGGPGATFWMILVGILGMSTKFTECSLAQIYRKIRPDGKVMGGAMEYLSQGLTKKGMGGLGRVLAVMFCVLCIGGSLGGGNAFQVNQSLGAVAETFPFLAQNPWLYGLILSILVGVVIIGGIKRIATTAEKIVPLMCVIYVLACLWILLSNYSLIPAAFSKILAEAFNPVAIKGGAIGVLIVGVTRAAFSNEAGIGSAAIAHAAAKTKYAVREGYVALLEPLIDTVLICTMTALVIVITGAYADPSLSELGGAALTSRAFGAQISWFPIILSISVMLFAYSTMISWSYYGERCWTYLFGENYTVIYRIIFVFAVFAGSVMTSTAVLEFSDLMILAMAIPNVLGLYLLQGDVFKALKKYQSKYKEA